MSAWVLVGLSTAAATGGIVVNWLVPRDISLGRRMALGVPFALLIGEALHSLWHLIWLVATSGSTARPAYVAYDFALPMALFLVSRMRRAPANDAPAPPLQNLHGRWSRMALAASGLACLGSSAIFLAIQVSAQPHGNWDAWAMWNYKARWFALAGASWDRLLTHGAPEIHPDYPLLLPLTIARFWLFSEGVPTQVPQVAAAIAGSLTMALLVGAGWVFGDVVAAVCAAGALLVMPSFLLQSAWQYADVPLSCFYLGALIAVALGVRRGGSLRWFTVAGLLAGAALWTKNEGALFAVATVVTVQLVYGRPNDGSRWTRTRAARVMTGMLPFAFAMTAMKIHTGAPNDLFAGQSWSTIWPRLTDPSRHIQILRFCSMMARSMFDWRALALFAGFVILRGRGSDLRLAGAVGLALALTACGYYAILLITPHDLWWQLSTAGPRLLIQLWPSTVLTFLLIGSRGVTGSAQPT